ncbi:threonine--tRNA ligase [Candidatus Saccharibacteria bacterium]|nr:MAG: threonine--tRNA ligase [Candidatus Saccharibacteria bacterium]
MADKSLDQNDQLHAMRHSLAHIMATAVTTLWPEAKLGVGPVIENGFYYDIDLGDQKISEEDFEKIEKKMRGVIAQDQTFERFELPVDEAIAWAKEAKQPYKEELLNDLKRAGTTVAKDLSSDEMGTVSEGEGQVENVSFYRNGDFTDLCRGPHAESTGKVGAFKLMRVAGAYWRGNEKNAQMQRLYGVAFATQEELDSFLKMQEEAKARDHRKLGSELDLFVFSDLVGSGLPLYTPRGTLIRDLLIRHSEGLRQAIGFQRVWTPHITKKELYEASGHWAKFGDELFLVKSQETSDELVMKPMNCPHHAQIYSSQPRSYRDLPLRYLETATCYRDEKSGELHGLSRVRSLTQDDSHTYCTEDQVAEVFQGSIKAIQAFYASIDMDLQVRLSFRDESDAYLGEQAQWDFGQAKIKEIAEANQLDFYIEEGEAAFYGPKIDFMAIDAIGRKWQVATIQIDFVQPERFDLTYVDAAGAKQRPFMIHVAIMGSFDRFFSVYIEHTAGWFPLWVAPEQVRVLTINDSVADYVDQIKAVLDDTVLMQPVKYNELRYSVDDRNESLGKKIRDAVGLKIPVVLIVGPKDVEAGEVSVRLQDGEQKVKLAQLHEFLTSL